MTEAATAPAPRMRLALVDALRGFAFLLMAVYHLGWDLDFFGVFRFDLYGSPWWLGFRYLILSSFLLLMGVSLVLADRPGVARTGARRRAFLRRLGLVVAGAVLISAYSYLVFPESGIFFGVLHFIAVASVLGLLFRRWLPVALVALAAGVVALSGFSHAAFDPPWLSWIGFAAQAPVSRDYVPIFPWFAVVLLGIAIGRLLPRRGPETAGILGALLTWTPRRAGGRLLAWSGRHSLVLYLVHQPALAALVYGAVLLGASAVGAPGIGDLLGGDGRSFERRFLDSCRAKCDSDGGSAARCLAICQCSLDALGRGLTPAERRAATPSPETIAKARALARQCLAKPTRP